MIGYYNYTVILTYLGLTSSIIGIYYSIEYHPFIGILCLLISGLCDMFDGKVARTKKRSKQEKDFGIQLDSLSDLVCFGILPITIGYSIGLEKAIYLPIFILYVLGALIRLAYFNTLENIRQESSNEVLKCYTGLPVTSVALILPFLYIFKNIIPYFEFVYLFTLLVIAILFVSTIKIKKPTLKTMFVFIAIGLLELILIILGLLGLVWK